MKIKIAVGIYLIWSALVFAIYYQRVWELLPLGLHHWIEDQYSLSVGLEFARHLINGTFRLGLPAWNEAVIRAGQGFLGAALVLAAAQALGWLLFGLMLWEPVHRADRILYRTAAGLGGIAFLSLALAALNAYQIHRVSALIGLLAVGGLIHLGLQRYARHKPAKVASKREIDQPKWPSAGRPGERLWQAVTGAAVLIAAIGALAPETESEAMWYHLSLPLKWLENGGPVHYIQEPISLYPLSWDLIFGAGLSIGGVAAAKWLNFSAFLLTLFLVYRLTDRFIPRSNPWLAAAIFATIPSVLWLSTTANIDMGLALHTGLVVYALLHYLEERERGWLALAILNLGLALASSHLALVVLFAAIAVLASVLWGAERSWKSLLPPAALGLAAITFPLPWYLRSLMVNGRLLSPGVLEAPDIHALYQWGAFDLLALPWNFTMNGAQFGGVVGPVFLILLPALLFKRNSSRAVLVIAAFGSLYILWSALLYSGLGARALLPAAPLAAALAAAGFGHVQRRLPGGILAGPVLHLTIGFILLLNLPPFTSLHTRHIDPPQRDTSSVIYRVPLGVVIGYETEEAYLRRKIPSYSAWQFANGHLSADSRVLTFSGDDHLYIRVERLRSESIADISTAWIETGGEEKRAVDRLRQLGITHVLMKKITDERIHPDLTILMEPDFIEHYYRIVYEDSWYILYELRNVQLRGIGG
jgi:hypothetical protein